MQQRKPRSRIIREFGKTVRQIRLKQDISQEELGRIAKLHRTYIGMIERGEKNITLENIEKIANALDTPIQKFFS